MLSAIAAYGIEIPQDLIKKMNSLHKLKLRSATLNFSQNIANMTKPFSS